MEFPLNQTYRKSLTYEKHPDIVNIESDYKSFCLDLAKWHKCGRAYDCAMTLYRINLENKVVCELGARDSIFSSYLTKFADKVYVSDIFEGWGDLGDLTVWSNLWKRFACNSDKLVCERQDMTKLSYPDESMDVVISFSAIEHIPRGGDIIAAREMSRICKKGGYIVIGTELNSENKTIWSSGSYFYSQEDLFKRIINNIDGKLQGDFDFSYENSDKDEEFSGIKFSSSIFVIKKNED